MWIKKNHADSSLQKKEGQYHLFIGRWQPLHEGHKQMFQQVLNRGEKICIAIREGKIDAQNPFSATQVNHNILMTYPTEIYEGRIKIIRIPDICSVNFGRNVGYDITEWIPPAEIAEVSATKIREQLNDSNNAND